MVVKIKIVIERFVIVDQVTIEMTKNQQMIVSFDLTSRPVLADELKTLSNFGWSWSWSY